MVSIAVEGLPDAEVAKRLIQICGGAPGPVYGLGGKIQLLQGLRGFNEAARRHPWLVLVDLDAKPDCAPALRREKLENPAPWMAFQVAVREMESWLLADRDRLAKYLGVSKQRIPDNPDSIPDPKQFLVNLARRSRKRAIREDMVPTPAGGRVVGPGYTSRLIEFVTDAEDGWRPVEAARYSDSLRRCIQRLQSLIQSWEVGAPYD